MCLEWDDNDDADEQNKEEINGESPDGGSPVELINRSGSSRNSASPLGSPTAPSNNGGNSGAGAGGLIEGRNNVSARERRAPGWMADYETGNSEEEEEDLNAMMMVMMVAENDPILFAGAIKHSKWDKAMTREIEAIEKNHTCELTVLPKGIKPIGVKWVYKTKLNEDGKLEKYKARLVAKGYAQCYGVDYTEVFAPVARFDTIRVILVVAAQSNWDVFQLDVKSAFLHGELKEEVFVQLPEGFIKKREEKKVYKLKKALYSLKQVPRAWYSRIKAYFMCEEFERCPIKHTLFTKIKGGKFIIVSLYVDDLIFTRNDRDMCEEFKK